MGHWQVLEKIKSIDKILAENIKRIRAARGMRKQDDLAEAASLSKSAIAQIESCAMWPRPDSLMAIAQALNVSVSVLFSEKEASIEFSAHDMVSSLRRVLNDETGAQALEQVFAEFLKK